MNKLSIKYKSCPKPTKIDAFEQKICNVTALLKTNGEGRYLDHSRYPLVFFIYWNCLYY